MLRVGGHARCLAYPLGWRLATELLLLLLALRYRSVAGSLARSFTRPLGGEVPVAPEGKRAALEPRASSRRSSRDAAPSERSPSQGPN